MSTGYEHNGNSKFQPFVGLSARQTFGQIKDFIKADEQNSGGLEAIIGIHSWF